MQAVFVSVLEKSGWRWLLLLLFIMGGCVAASSDTDLEVLSEPDMRLEISDADGLRSMDEGSLVPMDGQLSDQSVSDQSVSDQSIDMMSTPDFVSPRTDMGVERDDMGEPVVPNVPRVVAGLPRIYDFSGAATDEVDTLIRRALDGLGLDAETGPSPADRVFVNRWYIAWIDETGFYGKINGLWTLNGDLGQLDFKLLDEQRPVNTMVVGEFGRGEWPQGYKGAEHIEFPNATPEADDDPNCARTGSFCAQYSLNEALEYTDSDIPAWRACNYGTPSFSDHFEPIEISVLNDGLRIVYEGPLTKEGDFGGSSTGANCHGEFLFPDGVRRRVYLRVGYDLSADLQHVDRLIQIRNPPGNPMFDGPFGFIGGFVISRFPNPHPLKRLHHFARPEVRAVTVNWNDRSIQLQPQSWNALPADTPAHDIVLGWANQQVSLSPSPFFSAGKALSISNHGPNENGDTGFCLCVVHGGIEIGGGLRVGPVDGGVLTEASIRRLTIHDDEAAQERFRRIYEAETELNHGLGRADEDGWSANVSDESGHLIFGPYATDWGDRPIKVVFRMMIDVVNDTEEEVVNIDIHDATTQETLLSMPLIRRQFRAPFAYQDFEIEVDLMGRANHQIETRVFWHDISYVRVDRVTVIGQ
jgi:hypothetical protein